MADQERLTRAMGLALKALAGDGCAAKRVLGDGELSVVGVQRGVSLAVGRIGQETGKRLLESGLAEWRGQAERARLVLTDAGKLLARKLASADCLSDGHVLEERHLDHGPERVLVNERESPLAWLARRKGADGKPLLDPVCFAAGERLRADYERTGLSPRVTTDWGRFGSGSTFGRMGGSLSDAMMAARQRMEQALEEVGADMAGLLVDICCMLKGLDHVERERGWPPRSAKLVLGMALRRLASHYGLSDEARGRERSRGIVVWSDEGVRN
jgi:Domain of unknown function (DUF6456)